jgi:molybdate transport system regulatory protein
LATRARVQFRFRVSLGDDIAVGPGKVDLLEAIARNGSITGAARELGMSYRRAWLLVDTMNRCFRRPVVEGAALTASGEDVVRLYRQVEQSALRAARADIRALLRLLSK